MTVKVNRHGLLQSKGLPTCTAAPGPARLDERALKHCGDALVGSGPLLGHGRLPRPAPLPDPRAPPDLQRQGQGQARPLRPHLHHPTLRLLLRRSPSRSSTSPRGPTAPNSRPPCPGARRLGLRRPHQADPQAQIPLPGQGTHLLQRRLPGPRGHRHRLLPAGHRQLLPFGRRRNIGDCREGMQGEGMKPAGADSFAAQSDPRAGKLPREQETRHPRTRREAAATERDLRWSSARGSESRSTYVGGDVALIQSPRSARRAASRPSKHRNLIPLRSEGGEACMRGLISPASNRITDEVAVGLNAPSTTPSRHPLSPASAPSPSLEAT